MTDTYMNTCTSVCARLGGNSLSSCLLDGKTFGTKVVETRQAMYV